LTHKLCKSTYSPGGLTAAFEYSDPVLAKAIIWGKYKFLFSAYELLGKRLADHLAARKFTAIFENAVLCPIPLAKPRLRWRGFNQSAVLSQALSDQFGIPVQPLLFRRKSTKTQKDLPKAERLENVRNAFTINVPGQVEGGAIILVDDVITTGATFLEATKTLRQAGATDVWCLSLARD
jgi:ComF family protein